MMNKTKLLISLRTSFPKSSRPRKPPKGGEDRPHQKPILACAFRGKLGTNDASEESAVEHLRTTV